MQPFSPKRWDPFIGMIKGGITTAITSNEQENPITTATQLHRSKLLLYLQKVHQHFYAQAQK
jgi:hypothetical protein